ncbi:MAG TPA: FliA/WhiG family RNA polymerase sigma factor [Gemmatimonadaceae bacterium]|nr:FliA/WhiG family RNA polymerase sigma factor [Gemmatimonadaceae bacterium]
MPRKIRRPDAARDQLLKDHYALVHHVAHKLSRKLSTEASYDDLVSAGSVGLINAAENFDDSRGIAFSTFAVPRIRGAILDDLRAQDRASRSLRPKARSLNAAREAVAQRTCGTPTTRDVAAQLGVNVETIWEWDSQIDAARTASIDQPSASDDEGLSPWQFASQDESMDEAVARESAAETVRAALEALPPRERQVLALYYYEELTQAQIAQVLGVTESRVSQLRSQALARLRRNEPLRQANVA